MTISMIEITNIKGIDHKRLSVTITPNKPNLLVAPNGFGKSSIATAFACMNSRRLTLEKVDHHREDEGRAPSLSIKSNGTHLTADTTKNDIRTHFDVTVIRSGLAAKATRINAGKFTQAIASLEISPIEICAIPAKRAFDYRAAEAKAAFGRNGKILPNISNLLRNPLLARAISSVDFSKFSQVRNGIAINAAVDEINDQAGTSEAITQWIDENLADRLRAIAPLNGIAQSLHQLNLTSSQTEAFLAAYQIFKLHSANKENFKASIARLSYEDTKGKYEELLKGFCSSTWEWAQLKEIKGSLTVLFPKAHQLSNGQRDLLTLVIHMHRALYEGSKKPLLLLIDEVFDYLDDANLVAFQHYVTSLIETYKDSGQTIYPIILTHLDPGVFFDFCFNKHKLQISYLLAHPSGKSQNTLRLIAARDEEEAIKDRLEKSWFHYHVEHEEIEEAEWPRLLPREWRAPDDFHRYAHTELNRYLTNKNYDPLAVCFAVRILVERLTYDLLARAEERDKFLNEVRMTKNKINFAASCGVEIPETYFLLGLIYNTNLHWTPGRDYISPLANKLNHPTIKNLIKSIMES
ncbi:hypothetical protein E4195_18700 [Pseudomonas putida]|uniref:ATP-binding cassette domain-containing protein n=1 Tax=Pseudomonas putida TaxID=303 RepID=UPI001074B017|nr:ABC transporter ATP-binding protein [Pseudomonas putida]TFW36088.1 hypothetical protein E4195_18700 [Pseudomonas putida]